VPQQQAQEPYTVDLALHDFDMPVPSHEAWAINQLACIVSNKKLVIIGIIAADIIIFCGKLQILLLM
jgi:hypothetical protein